MADRPMNEIKITKSSNSAFGLGRRSASRGEHAGRRSKGRDSLFLMATIRKAGQDDANEIPVRVRNLSEVGLMADYLDTADAGQAVTVEVRGLGIVPGKVAWVEDRRIGITFNTKVDPLLARKPVGGKG
jgi:hypothetical protein